MGANANDVRTSQLMTLLELRKRALLRNSADTKANCLEQSRPRGGKLNLWSAHFWAAIHLCCQENLTFIAR
jgi:hypothetical protein